jgi:hypothetical protein
MEQFAALRLPSVPSSPAVQLAEQGKGLDNEGDDADAEDWA